MVLKWRPFEYKTKFEKKSLLFRSEIDIWFEKICKSIVIENFKLVPLCPIKMAAL